jgi:hypothetical protein
VLVEPYPPCTQTSAAATGIFEGGVGNPTSDGLSCHYLGKPIFVDEIRVQIFAEISNFRTKDYYLFHVLFVT